MNSIRLAKGLDLTSLGLSFAGFLRRLDACILNFSALRAITLIVPIRLKLFICSVLRLGPMRFAKILILGLSSLYKAYSRNYQRI